MVSDASAHQTARIKKALNLNRPLANLTFNYDTAKGQAGELQLTVAADRTA